MFRVKVQHDARDVTPVGTFGITAAASWM